jgi:predicted kinase
MSETTKKGRLAIVCGLPGSGKTTLAKKLESAYGAVRLSPDDWMHSLEIDIYDEPTRAKIERLQWTLAQRMLGLGASVIIEWGTWARSERDALRLRARELGTTVELHYLQAPEEVLFERISRRGMENPPITRESLADWIKVFQAPDEEEMALFDRPLD